MAEEDENLMTRIAEFMPALLHDISNTATVNNSNLLIALKLMELNKDHDEIKKYVHAGHEASVQIIELVRLTQQVMRNGQVAYNPKPLSLKSIVDDSLTICEASLTRYNIKISKNYLSKDESMFYGDYTRMVQVMINLCSNMKEALKTTKSPQVTVTLDTLIGDDRNIGSLVVSNNGPAIPYDNVDDVFTPHVTTKNGSSGLGLSICRDIIQSKFCGQMYAKNLEEGGVAFYIELPLCTPQEVLESIQKQG